MEISYRRLAHPDWSSDTTLTFSAAGDIEINQPIGNFGAFPTDGALILDAGGEISTSSVGDVRRPKLCSRKRRLAATRTVTSVVFGR